ncbi:MAG: O-antigen ligase family protein [Neisseriaceae bacterium]|nr:O-antigen ligase family protein [Neisseriaceae bacterium]MBP6863091.1 O-antigen ligase family protein [Neisseriaceae bacterium]
MIKNNFFKHFATFGMVLFMGVNVVPIGKLRGYEVGAILLLLTALVFLVKRPRPKIQLSRPDKWLLLAGMLYVLVSCIEVWLDNQPIRGYDHASRFILTIPILCLLLVYPPRANHFFQAAAVGGLLLGGTSIYYKLILGEPSTLGLLSIQYACISMVIAAISLSGIGYFYQCRRVALCLLSLFGSLLGVVAVFLSGSRGSWASIFVLLALMFWTYRHILKLKLMMLILAVVMALCTSLYLAPQTKVQVRIQQAFVDVEQWQDNQLRSSLGDRFVMWDNAVELGQKKWFMGWGAQGFMAEKQRQYEAGEISKSVQLYAHPHHEFLNAWVKRGLPGALALLLIYVVPILTFKRYLHQSHSVAVRSVALASISVPVCFMIAGFSQTVFAHNSGVLFYVVGLTLCWTILKGTVNEQRAVAASGR